MKIKGRFIVAVSDGVDQYHPNGGWRIGSARSVDWESYDELEANRRDLTSRLSAVSPGDRVDAASHTGGTGVKGTVVSRSENGRFLVVQGEAWGASHSAFARWNRIGWRTHTFDVRPVRPESARYAGSLSECVGLPATHRTISSVTRAADNRKCRCFGNRSPKRLQRLIASLSAAV